MSAAPIEVISDNEADELVRKGFVPSDWIGVGRAFTDCDWTAEVAFERHMQVPSAFEDVVPSRNMSPMAAACASLDGHWAPCDENVDNIASHCFSMGPPNLACTAEDILKLLLPSEGVLRALRDRAGQAWMDGNRSVRFWRISGEGKDDWVLCPLWMITAVQDAYSMQRAGWAEAWEWIDEVEATATHSGLGLCQLARKYMNRLPGCFGYAAGSDLTYEKLALLLGHHFLHGAIVDHLIYVACDSDVAQASSSGIIFADTLFAQALAEGSHHAPSSLSDRILRRYAARLRDGSVHTILFPVNISNVHWTPGKIDCRSRIIHYGDSMLPYGVGRPPLPLERNMVEWLQSVLTDVEFRWQTDLHCPLQKDGWNCGIITANVLAREGLGERLWDSEIADELRLHAFCKICERLLLRPEGGHEREFNFDSDSPPPPSPPGSFTFFSDPVEPVGERVAELENPSEALARLNGEQDSAFEPLSSLARSVSLFRVRRRAQRQLRLEFEIDEDDGTLIPMPWIGSQHSTYLSDASSYT